ncbi:MAG: peptidylprolyl isomerase [Pirellulaceae bacterium]|nr:peptidylprolyl isomerase [Pirellulaceae bacterium]
MREKVDESLKSIDFETHQYQVHLDTNHGPIRLNLFSDDAPGHCKNIAGLAKTGYYDGKIFHRVIDGFMIQGGCPNGTGTGGPGYTIDAEFNARPHKPGTLSMARTSDPNSAGSQFFICLARQDFLDNQYTVFGETSDEESLETVMKIGSSETDGSDRPLADVVIATATVVKL